MSTLGTMPRRAAQHRYYLTAWVVIAGLTLWGFGPSFFLPGLVQSSDLAPLLRLHGLVMTAWLFVFLLQTRLVASDRVRWHRRVGVAGAIVGFAVLAVGLATTLRAARFREGPPGVPTDVFVLASLAALATFALFFLAALALRRRPDWHQRLMLLATLMLLGAGVSRLPYEHFPWPDFWRSGGPFGLFTIDMLVIYACAGWDTARSRRLHPAYGWGVAALLLLNNALVVLVAELPAWRGLVQALAS
ncbi:MAG TPA: hypothetical protein VMU47_05030 [Caldimonas sp.]|nr:hypothetical protein [Caldimonas sp.]